jgi:hypothetical protein
MTNHSSPQLAIPERLPKLNVAELLLKSSNQTSRLDISDIKATERSMASEYHIRDRRIQE